MLWVPLLGLCCYLLVEYAPAPFLWVALLTVAFCAWRFRRARSSAAKLVWLNSGVVVLTFGALELMLWTRYVAPPDFVKGFAPGYGFVSHVDYGYGPLAPSRTRVIKESEGKPIYDVFYTVDEYGMRVSPPELDPTRRRGCVLFFGCSYTYGEGVQDDETMPWQVGVKSGGRYAVRNMGFHGYGPHQMLAALESGEAERLAHCDVTHVIYQSLYWHAPRAAGRSFWDQDGPRYLLDADRRAMRAGYFSDDPVRGRLPRSVLDRLKKSLVYKEYFDAYVDPYEYPIARRELNLLAAIVDRSREEVARRFPHASFDVLVWDNLLVARQTTDFVRRLTKHGTKVHQLSQAFGEYERPYDPRYVLSSADRHPNPSAHERVAEYVVKNILHDSGE